MGEQHPYEEIEDAARDMVALLRHYGQNGAELGGDAAQILDHANLRVLAQVLIGALYEQLLALARARGRESDEDAHAAVLEQIQAIQLQLAADPTQARPDD